MTIAIIGAGAIGSVVAVYLAKAGEDIVLVGRKDQVEAIQKTVCVLSARVVRKLFLSRHSHGWTVNMIWSFLRSRRRILKKRARITRHF